MLSRASSPVAFLVLGIYETGVGSYKHVYFNVTENTLIIWTMTVVAVICLYEAIRMVFLALYHGEKRLQACGTSVN